MVLYGFFAVFWLLHSSSFLVAAMCHVLPLHSAASLSRTCSSPAAAQVERVCGRGRIGASKNFGNESQASGTARHREIVCVHTHFLQQGAQLAAPSL